MQQWMSLINLPLMTVAMVALVAFIASVGYAAMLVARRETRT